MEMNENKSDESCNTQQHSEESEDENVTAQQRLG